MIVRLGYVAISNKLGKKATSSSTVTYSNYKKLISDEKKFEKLKTVIMSNLNGLEKHIKYNIENNIQKTIITIKIRVLTISATPVLIRSHKLYKSAGTPLFFCF